MDKLPEGHKRFDAAAASAVERCLADGRMFGVDELADDAVRKVWRDQREESTAESNEVARASLQRLADYVADELKPEGLASRPVTRVIEHFFSEAVVRSGLDVSPIVFGAEIPRIVDGGHRSVRLEGDE